MSTPDIFVGIDVGKTTHYAYVMDAYGEKIFSRPVPNTNHDLLKLFKQAGSYGTPLIVVDQPNNIGKLAVSIASNYNFAIAYLPGLAMRNLARTYRGNTKNDKRDAFIIADTARTRPDALRPTNHQEEVFTSLKHLNGLDDDLRRHTTSHINQLRAVLLNCYPELEKALAGDNLTRRWVLEILLHYQTPATMARQPIDKLITTAISYKARNPRPLLEAMIKAIKAQTITIHGTTELVFAIKTHAKLILDYQRQRKDLEKHVRELAATVPQYHQLITVPGIGPKIAAVILMCVGDLSNFKTAAQLASYAGISPQTKQSGSSINSSGPNRGGNKKLKNALWQSAFASISNHERSREYYDRKRSEHKRHNAAVMCLARRKVNVIFRMLKDGTTYNDNHPHQQQAA